jgi:DNA-binding transcriptional LysR family regulator
MNTRFLETLVMLAQLKSFRATARALHTTPAAISLRIKALEDELRTELVDRSAKDFQLTANAEYLLSYAKAVVDATQRLQNAARNESVVQGKLRLGVVETVVHSWLSDYIREINGSHPQLDIDLIVDGSALIEKKLRARELDLALSIEGSNSAEIISEPLALYPFRWIARSGLLLTHKEGLVNRVLQFPILTFGRGTTPHRALEEIVTKLANHSTTSLERTRITCSPSVATIIQLVRDGFGIAAIPKLLVKSQLENGEFVELPVQPLPPSVVVSMSRHTSASMAVHAAAAIARTACSSYCRRVSRNYIDALC